MAVDRPNVLVAVRLRPPSDSKEDFKEIFEVAHTELVVHDPLSHGRNEHLFSFGHVFRPEHGQESVFNGVARPLIDRVLCGFNTCLFAYGQTGSGKTHSVFGEGNAEERGMLARSLEYLFEKIEERKREVEVGMVVSFQEIYLDQVRDLGRFYIDKCHGPRRPSVEALEQQRPGESHRMPLRRASTVGDGRPSAARPGTLAQTAGEGSLTGQRDQVDPYLAQDLQIRESPEGLIYVDGLTRIPVGDIREVLEVVNLGVQMRATYETKLNARSSRSHTIFTVNIAQKSRNGGSAACETGMVNFVDLAGSERLARSQSEGKRFQEAVVINTSLSALGKVVLALATANTGHIPYRDSKLTRILQNSLGGNSFTTLLATIDPSASNYDESLNSLHFADRCKNVQTRPVLNVVDQEQDMHRKAMQKLSEEITNLRMQLDATAPKDIAPGCAGGLLSVDSAGAGAGSRRPSRRLSAAPPCEISVPQRAPSGSTWSSERDQADPATLLRQERLAAEEKVEMLAEELERERECQAVQEENSRREVAAARERNRALELEITKCQSRLSHVRRIVSSSLEDELQAFEKSTAEVLLGKEELLRHISSDLTVATAAASDRCDEQIAELDEWARAVERGHEDDVEAWDRVASSTLAGRQAVGQRLAGEIKEFREQVAHARQQMNADLISVHTLAQELDALVELMSRGVPAQLKTGIHPPAPPKENLRAKLESQGSIPDRSLEQLRRDMAEVKRQVGKCQRRILELEPSSTGAGAEPPGSSCASSAPSASPKGSPGRGSVPSKDQGSQRMLGDAWDAEALAREFCDDLGFGEVRGGASSADDPPTLPLLHRLGAEHLRELCLALRRRARMSSEMVEVERERLRCEVAKDLTSHRRMDEIRTLEQDILTYKVKLCLEEERAKDLELALRSCERAADLAAVGASRPPSNSRPGSSGPLAQQPQAALPPRGGASTERQGTAAVLQSAASAGCSSRAVDRQPGRGRPVSAGPSALSKRPGSADSATLLPR